jgi:hypothetical protein
MRVEAYGDYYSSEKINREVEKDFPVLEFPGRKEEQKDCVTITMRFPHDVYCSLKELSRLEMRVIDQEVFYLITQAAELLYKTKYKNSA